MRLKRPERPTRIEGLTEFRRPQIIGAIKIGERVGGCKKCKKEWPLDNGDEKLKCPTCGNTDTRTKETRVYTRPAKLDYFKIVPDDEDLLPLIQEIYGDKPTSIDVKLPVFIPTTSAEPDPEVDLEGIRDVTFPQSLTRFVKSGLVCTGDGIRALRYDENPDGAEIDCVPDKCEFYERGDCSPSARLRVYLYRLPTFGVFQISTRSWNSIVDINTAIDNIYAIGEMIAEQSGSTLATILPQLPLRLRVKEARGKDDKGRVTKYNKLSLDIGAGIIPYLASEDLVLGLAPEALPPKTEGDEEIEKYLEEDPDKHRHDLIAEIKDLPPYKIDPANFPDGKIEFEDMAEHTSKAVDFAETIIGRREKSLDKMTTPELEILVEAVRVYEDEGMYGEENAKEASEEIRAEEAEALINYIKEKALSAGDVARFVDNCFPDEKHVRSVTHKVIRTWSVDRITVFSEYLKEQFKK